MPVEMDYGPNKHRLAATRRTEGSLPNLKSSLPSLTGGAISFVPETNHPLQRFQFDLEGRKPVSVGNRDTLEVT